MKQQKLKWSDPYENTEPLNSDSTPFVYLLALKCREIPAVVTSHTSDYLRSLTTVGTVRGRGLHESNGHVVYVVVYSYFSSVNKTIKAIKMILRAISSFFVSQKYSGIKPLDFIP